MYTLLEALGLVVIVVFIFLQGWRATLIPLLAVPVSLIGTFIIFPALGFSINTLSLFGLVLAIGLVVDDAIIVVEAVEHHIDEGMDPKSATEKAMEEVGGPVVAIALILAAVFIPNCGNSRHHRPHVSAVRRHDRDFGSDLRFQCPHLVPGARFACFSSRERKVARRAYSAGDSRSSINSSAANTDAFVGTSRVLIHKSAFAMLGTCTGWRRGCLPGQQPPGGFIPTEDQGYMFLALQLPDGASAQRTDAAQQKITAHC